MNKNPPLARGMIGANRVTAYFSVPAIKSLPLIHTGYTTAWIEPLGIEYQGHGPSVSGWDGASAWEAMCVKLTEIPVRPVPLWDATRKKLRDHHRQAQQTLCRVVYAKRNLAQVLLAIGSRDGRAACEAVDACMGSEATDTYALLDGGSVTNEAACEAALRDAVRHAAAWAVLGAQYAETLATLDAELSSSSERSSYFGSPTRAMIQALRHRLCFEVGYTLVALGLALPRSASGSILLQLDPADMADHEAFAQRVLGFWSACPDAALRASLSGMEKMRHARAFAA